jgi:hypothetical protein
LALVRLLLVPLSNTKKGGEGMTLARTQQTMPVLQITKSG